MKKILIAHCAVCLIVLLLAIFGSTLISMILSFFS